MLLETVGGSGSATWPPSWNASNGEPCGGGNGWDSWSGGWAGLQCDGAGGSVAQIDRDELGLADAGRLAGNITGWGALTGLTHLDLHSTAVSGDVSGFSALTSLTYLSLSRTPVSGDVSGFSALTSLGWLGLSSTSVSGDVSGFSALTSLTSLSLSSTSVSALCSAGDAGALQAGSSGQWVCAPTVSCPPDSTGANVSSGCTCDAGSNGTIIATGSSPYYSGSCAAVSCPPDSTGANVSSGCTCDAGSNGTIIATRSSPYYSGSCTTLVGCVPIPTRIEDAIVTRDPPERLFHRSFTSGDAFHVRVDAALPSECDALDFAWTSPDGSPEFAVHEPTSNTPSLYMPAGAIAENSTVSVAVTVTVSGCAGPPACNTTSVVTLARGLDPLTVSIAGGTFRTVGRTENFTLVAETNMINTSSLSFSWACTDHRGSVVATFATVGQSAWTMSSSGLTSDEEYVCIVAVQSGSSPNDGRNDSATTTIFVANRTPPTVLIVSKAAGAKFDPSQVLRLLGTVAVAGVETEALDLQWSVRRYTASGSSFRASVQAATTFTGLNFVLQPNSLLPNSLYSFHLTATTADGTAGESHIDVRTNTAPAGDRLACAPSSGMAARDTFVLTATGWIDDDLPLEYRFGSVSAAGSTPEYMSEFRRSDEARAMLPAGKPDENFSVVLVVEVRDSYRATAVATTANGTFVLPFVVPDNTSLRPQLKTCWRHRGATQKLSGRWCQAWPAR
eukprot:SAG22_NODE_171_length_16646_cov_6.580528_8_plen_731_part_00